MDPGPPLRRLRRRVLDRRGRRRRAVGGRHGRGHLHGVTALDPVTRALERIRRERHPAPLLARSAARRARPPRRPPTAFRRRRGRRHRPGSSRTGCGSVATTDLAVEPGRVLASEAAEDLPGADLDDDLGRSAQRRRQPVHEPDGVAQVRHPVVRTADLVGVDHRSCEVRDERDQRCGESDRRGELAEAIEDRLDEMRVRRHRDPQATGLDALLFEPPGELGHRLLAPGDGAELGLVDGRDREVVPQLAARSSSAASGTLSIAPARQRLEQLCLEARRARPRLRGASRRRGMPRCTRRGCARSSGPAGRPATRAAARWRTRRRTRPAGRE